MQRGEVDGIWLYAGEEGVTAIVSVGPPLFERDGRLIVDDSTMEWLVVWPLVTLVKHELSSVRL